MDLGKKLNGTLTYLQHHFKIINMFEDFDASLYNLKDSEDKDRKGKGKPTPRMFDPENLPEGVEFVEAKDSSADLDKTPYFRILMEFGDTFGGFMSQELKSNIEVKVNAEIRHITIQGEEEGAEIEGYVKIISIIIEFFKNGKLVHTDIQEDKAEYKTKDKEPTDEFMLERVAFTIVHYLMATSAKMFNVGEKLKEAKGKPIKVDKTVN